MHETGKRDLSAGARRHQQYFFPDQAQDVEQRHPGPLRDGAEHHEDEKQAARVIREHEPPEVKQRGAARTADDGRERAEGAERSQEHDEAKNPEDHRLKLADRRHDHRVALQREARGHADEKRDEQLLQNLAFGKRVHRRDRNDPEQEADDGELAGWPRARPRRRRQA